MSKSWTSKELADVSRRRNEGQSWPDVGLAYGTTSRAARSAYDRAKGKDTTDGDVVGRLAQKMSQPSVVVAQPAVSSSKVLFVPDTHVPYHDKRAWALMLKAARGWQPDQVVVLGDLVDFFAVSFHPKPPSRRQNLEYEIESLVEVLGELDTLGAKRRVYVSGNHEHRLQRYLTQNAPALYNMLQLEEILKLKDKGWLWVPYMKHTKVGSAYVTHDFGDHGVNAHNKARQTMNADAVIGHTHRMAMHYHSQADGTTTVGAMFGHMLDIESVDYMHRARTHAWQLGFGIGHITSDGKTHMHGVPIVNYRCVVDGVVYEQEPVRLCPSSGHTSRTSMMTRFGTSSGRSTHALKKANLYCHSPFALEAETSTWHWRWWTFCSRLLSLWQPWLLVMLSLLGLLFWLPEALVTATLHRWPR